MSKGKNRPVRLHCTADKANHREKIVVVLLRCTVVLHKSLSCFTQNIHGTSVVPVLGINNIHMLTKALSPEVLIRCCDLEAYHGTVA